jgi:hypothetical protein
MRHYLARLYPAGVACDGVLATILVLTDVHDKIRAFVVLPFLLVGPGLALMNLLGLGDLLALVVLAIAVSLALEVIVSLAMLYGGFWSPSLGMSILTGIVVVATAVSYIAGPRGGRYVAGNPGTLSMNLSEGVVRVGRWRPTQPIGPRVAAG